MQSKVALSTSGDITRVEVSGNERTCLLLCLEGFIILAKNLGVSNRIAASMLFDVSDILEKELPGVLIDERF